MSEPMATAVSALAGDRADRLSGLPQRDRIMVLAISAAARTLALHATVDYAIKTLRRVRRLVSHP
ncbi:hypothetical protein AB0451_36595 [Streptomyces sp. NPDC052000]|uniref:hypothetical protein n=1 Tax=Streptomyces sp. NPDC052000 TaxID=3155676 RepID=UPI00344D374C